MAHYTMLFYEFVQDYGLPTFDTTIPNFDDMLKNRYLDCEIGFETPLLFKAKLKAKADIVLPKYEERYNLLNQYYLKLAQGTHRVYDDTTTTSESVQQSGSNVLSETASGTSGNTNVLSESTHETESGHGQVNETDHTTNSGLTENQSTSHGESTNSGTLDETNNSETNGSQNVGLVKSETYELPFDNSDTGVLPSQKTLTQPTTTTTSGTNNNTKHTSNSGTSSTDGTSTSSTSTSGTTDATKATTSSSDNTKNINHDATTTDNGTMSNNHDATTTTSGSNERSVDGTAQHVETGESVDEILRVIDKLQGKIYILFDDLLNEFKTLFMGIY